MRKLAIRLVEADAKKYGRRVLLPGTAEHAAYLRDKGHTLPKYTDTPQPTATEPRPTITHEVLEDGSWTISVDGDVYARGSGGDDFRAALARAQAGEPAQTQDFAAMKVTELREAATERGISYAGLKKADLVRALQESEG